MCSHQESAVLLTFPPPHVVFPLFPSASLCHWCSDILACQTRQALVQLSRFVVYLTFGYLGPLYLHSAFMSSKPSPSRILNKFGVILRVTAAFCFFFFSVFFSSLCEGKISTKKMSEGVNLVASYFPWVCGVAALLPGKHLGAGHLCIQPPASSSHPCHCFCPHCLISRSRNRCWHKPSCFRWTIHKLNLPEK